MTEKQRYAAAAALFVAGSVLLATMLVNLPDNTVATTALTAGLGWFVLYPVARLTWLRGIAEWRYWAAGGVITLGAPLLYVVRRQNGLDPIPWPLSWFPAALMLIVVAALLRRGLRRQ